ncbi:unnamed protein product [Bursaphelenchus xylophilus]|uniref:(pine wood nematode) hypothetical protein n=1 Tax=Bursaphelenchus xylophilus TaxID=6326 RepID=A0A1I7RHA1_BURXY|nr:unnamed protein product [Bursaphelenchus xylophilus]CAG9115902.1 unnamed protein product [Bursaphelenchus xylophilus]
MYKKVNHSSWLLEKHLEEERRAREQDRVLFQQQLSKERYDKQCLRQKVTDNAILTRNLILYARSLEEENRRILHYISTAKKVQRNIMNQLSCQPPTKSIKIVSI